VVLYQKMTEDYPHKYNNAQNSDKNVRARELAKIDV